MTPTLHDRLVDLAEDAPPGAPAPDLWESGVRRQRRRRNVAIAGAALAVVLVAAVGTRLHPDPRPEPADVPFGELHVPRVAYPPSPWADGTDDVGAPGPLAFVSMAERYQVEGVRGTSTAFRPFGVSAVDGSAVFLDLHGARLAALGSYALALSPDGMKVGYTRYGKGARAPGWAVYDTVTGETTVLGDPEQDPITRADTTDLSFSGDSRYLETVYSPTGSMESRTASLILWDVRTGEQVEAEPAGHYWLPNLGRGPSGTIWSRKSTTFTFRPGSGATTSVRTPFDVVEAGVAPDGRGRAFIAFGANDRANWRLFVGTGVDDLTPVPLDIDADDLLGWRDPDHVVVRQLPTGEAVEVDIATGRTTSLALDVTGRQMTLPSYAADLWANPLVDGERPPHVHDPRLPAWVAAGVGVVAALGGLVLWRRRHVRA